MIPIIPRDEFELLWNSQEMPEKVAAGLFEERIKETSATSPRFVGGRSLIVKLVSSNGFHIGTIHRIVMPDGSVPHEHGKDYTLRDCSRVRTGEA